MRCVRVKPLQRLELGRGQLDRRSLRSTLWCSLRHLAGGFLSCCRCLRGSGPRGPEAHCRLKGIGVGCAPSSFVPVAIPNRLAVGVGPGLLAVRSHLLRRDVLSVSCILDTLETVLQLTTLDVTAAPDGVLDLGP